MTRRLAGFTANRHRTSAGHLRTCGSGRRQLDRLTVRTNARCGQMGDTRPTPGECRGGRPRRRPGPECTPPSCEDAVFTACGQRVEPGPARRLPWWVLLPVAPVLGDGPPDRLSDRHDRRDRPAAPKRRKKERAPWLTSPATSPLYGHGSWNAWPRMRASRPRTARGCSARSLSR